MSPKKLHEYEKRGVGLLSAGAYILSSIPDRELEKIASNNFKTVSWETHPRLITIRSAVRGAQARFGRVSADGNWLSYPALNPVYGSVQAFHAEVEKIDAFINRMLTSEEPLWVVRKAGARSTKKDGVGFLVAEDSTSRHNALVCCDAEGIHLIPFELEPPDHAVHELATVSPAKSDEHRTRAELKQASRRAARGLDERFRNTSVSFRGED